MREILKRLLLLPVCCFRVDIHCGLDIAMPHNGLDHLEIGLVLTKPRAERMPQNVTGKAGQKKRFPFFFCCCKNLLIVVGTYDSFDRCIHGARIGDIPEPVTEYKSFHSVDLRFIETVLLLLLVQHLESVKDHVHHRNRPDARFCFRRGYPEFTDPVITQGVIDQGVVDADDPLLKVQVLPAQADCLPDPAPGAKKDREHRPPVEIEHRRTSKRQGHTAVRDRLRRRNRHAGRCDTTKNAP